MKHQEVVAALGALAQDSRLAIYRLLVKQGPGGYPAGEISTQLGVPSPTLSFHLKELARVGLIDARRESRFVYYAANFERMNDVLSYLSENCCGQEAQCAPRCTPRRAIDRSRRSA